jgi:ABC-2 type transport system ATP-binding protein
LGIALLTGSRLLLLDEPMTGLDPAAQHEMRDVLRQRLDAGAAVLISTHNLAEVEALADILVFLKGGRVLASGFTTDFLRDGTLSIEIGEAQTARRVLEAAGYQILSAQRTEVVLHKDANAEGEKIARVLAEAGLYPRSIHARRGSLEEVYLQVMEGDTGT